MNTFRAFILNEQNKIIRAEVLSVASDTEAVAASLSFAAENDLEVWQGQRRIARVRKGGAVDLFPVRDENQG